MNRYDPDDRLSAEEAARFAALPRAVDGDDIAEERTVASLRRHGLLRMRRSTAPRPLRALMMLAASVTLFASGVIYGKTRVRETGTAVSPVDEVQRAGTAYVAALVRLSEGATRDSSGELAAGLEAGTTTLRAAAANAARLLPHDSTLGRIRDGLELAASLSADAARWERTFIWY